MKRRRRTLAPLAAANGDILGLILRWCAPRTLFTILAVNQTMAGAAKAVAAQCFEELAAAWDTVRKLGFRDRVRAAQTLYYLGRLCGRRPRVSLRFHVRLLVETSGYKRNFLYDHCVVELLYMTFGHLSPLMGYRCGTNVDPTPVYPHDPRERSAYLEYEDFIRTLITHVEHQRHQHVTMRDVDLAISTMGSMAAPCPRTHKKFAQIASPLDGDETDDADDADYAPSESEDDEEDAGVLTMYRTSESSCSRSNMWGEFAEWYSCLECFFDDESNFEELFGVDLHPKQDMRFSTCSIPHCCHRRCDCRSSLSLLCAAARWSEDGSYHLATTLKRWACADFTSGEVNPVLLINDEQELRISERAHELSFVYSDRNPTSSTSCRAVLKDRRQWHLFQAWRSNGNADSWGAAAQMGMQVQVAPPPGAEGTLVFDRAARRDRSLDR
jgi:hypothetical protein